jgi:hypothetical protein
MNSAILMPENELANRNILVHFAQWVLNQWVRCSYLVCVLTIPPQ